MNMVVDQTLRINTKERKACRQEFLYVLSVMSIM